MNDIVILTPTYNRADTLVRLYESLKKQHNKNFDWIIVDDGSTDETKRFVDEASAENIIDITYIFQTNGGKARALNTGFAACSYASVFVIVDSDDYLLPTAVDTVSDYLTRYRSNEEIGAFFFLYQTQDGSIIKPRGKVIDEDKLMTRYQYNNKYILNDGCVCYLDRAVKKYRYPEFQGEKYVGPTVIQMEMASEFKMVFSPKVIGVAEYLAGGLSRSGRQLRFKNPNGMMYYASLMMSTKSKLSTQFKYAISIWPYAKLADKSFFEVLKMVKRPVLLMITYIPGMLLYMYWKRKVSRHDA